MIVVAFDKTLKSVFIPESSKSIILEWKLDTRENLAFSSSSFFILVVSVWPVYIYILILANDVNIISERAYYMCISVLRNLRIKTKLKRST